MLYITQKVQGFKFGQLEVDTKIDGQTPRFGVITNFYRRNITETYAEEEPGIVMGATYVDLLVNGRKYNVKILRLLKYAPYPRLTSIPKHGLNIKVSNSSYSLFRGLVFHFEPFLREDSTSTKGIEFLFFGETFNILVILVMKFLPHIS